MWATCDLGLWSCVRQFDWALGAQPHSKQGRDKTWLRKEPLWRCTMPHNVFLCRDCNKKVEQRLLISEFEKTSVKCSHCGSQKVEQHAAAFAAVSSKKS
jgi:DNA-directed RNA polymerase subunit RPC12/RpoP